MDWLIVPALIALAWWLGYRMGYRHGAEDYKPPIYTHVTGDSAQ